MNSTAITNCNAIAIAGWIRRRRRRLGRRPVSDKGQTNPSPHRPCSNFLITVLTACEVRSGALAPPFPLAAVSVSVGWLLPFPSPWPCWRPLYMLSWPWSWFCLTRLSIISASSDSGPDHGSNVGNIRVKRPTRVHISVSAMGPCIWRKAGRAGWQWVSLGKRGRTVPKFELRRAASARTSAFA